MEDNSESKNDLKRLREEINRIDSEILDLLNKRGQLACRIGLVKSLQGLAVHDPSREREVLVRLKQENKGPFSNAFIERLFHIIFEEAKNLQNHDQSKETV